MRVGPALDQLPSLSTATARSTWSSSTPTSASYTEYLSWALTLSRAGTLIIVDNVVRDGKITDAASTDANVQGVRRFNEALSRDRA